MRNLTKKPSDIFGLTYIPSFEPNISDDLDIEKDTRMYNVSAEVSNNDRLLLEKILAEHKNNINFIVEIGIDRNGVYSFTRSFFEFKKPETVYLGIDIDDKSYLNEPNRNIFTLKCNSHDQSTIRNKIAEFNRPIDLLFIDGWHSINTVVNDWKYANLLSKNGIVVFHDTNYHLGPRNVVDAIDRNLFEVSYFFENENDWGMAYAIKK